jgi:glutamine amidotransferase
MGWNRIFFSAKKSQECPLLTGVPEESYVYFVHSYYGVVEDQEIVTAQTEYGVKFTSMIWRKNLFATQFHPEKSQAVGLKILKNFATL